MYGQAQSQVLALDDPNDAVHNADNHEVGVVLSMSLTWFGI